MSRAFVLLSGGLDSTTCLAIALKEFGGDVEAIGIDYGQRHLKETEYAAAFCSAHAIPYTIYSAGDLLKGSMLTDDGIPIPDARYDELPEGVSPTYVPFRNGLMLSMIAAHAQKWANSVKRPGFIQETGGIYFGAHAEDAQRWAYPDCTPEFIGAMANAIYVGTYHAIRLHTPLMWLQKFQIVRLGAELGVDFAKTWSCYAGGRLHCGKCPTCHARKEAFVKAGIKDPTEYAD